RTCVTATQRAAVCRGRLVALPSRTHRRRIARARDRGVAYPRRARGHAAPVHFGGRGHRRPLALRGARGRCRHPATRVAVWKDVTTMKFLATEPAAGLLRVALAAC